MYKIERNILSSKDLIHIKNLLKELHWKIARDNNKFREQMFDIDQPFQGMYRETFEPADQIEKKLNVFAEKVADEVCKRQNLKTRIIRITWNLYRKSDVGMDFHMDTSNILVDVHKYWSILFSLNSTDCYLQLNKLKIKDVENEAKLYKSNLLHKGVAPTKKNFRLNLNLVLKET